jgi:hypothetical protein
MVGKVSAESVDASGDVLEALVLGVLIPQGSGGAGVAHELLDRQASTASI